MFDSAKRFSMIRLVFVCLQVWSYISGVLLLIVGLEAVSGMLQYGAVLILFGVICQLITDKILPVFHPGVDEYAASVHQAGIQQFFQSIEHPKLNVQRRLPEIIERTSFHRRREIYPLIKVYQLVTNAFALAGATIVVYFLYGSLPVYIFATALLLVYLLDDLFEVRSDLFFMAQSVDVTEYGDDLERLEQVISALSEDAGITQPRVKFSDESSFIAGAVNPVLGRPRLYLSTEMLTAPPHLQKGILAHEIGHLKLENRQYWIDTALHSLIPVTLIMFVSIKLTVWSSILCFIGVCLSMMLLTKYLIREEFMADEIASELTSADFVILSLLEFTAQNPFVGQSIPFGEVLIEWSGSHPQLHKRIKKLASVNQKFN